MDKYEIINYWRETADKDYNTMIHLYESKDYNWSLFLGHLVIEKLLKALYVKNVDKNVPKTHDLLRLAEKAGIETTEEQKDLFDLITTFNISVRYPDYKQSFYKKCNQEFTKINIEKIEELRKWLLSMIETE
ncbi:MAG: HEPN domain-containing protein [Caloramator sp.]|nr:HEPN domain-containing protein [Caloramator sp.]